MTTDDSTPVSDPSTITADDHVEAIHADALSAAPTPGRPPDPSILQLRHDRTNEDLARLHRVLHATRSRFITVAEYDRLQAVLPPNLLELIERVRVDTLPPGEALTNVESDDQMWSPPSRPQVAYLEQQIAFLSTDLDRVATAYHGATQTIAEMHAAAVGSVTGPIRGVVEDVADLKAQHDKLKTYMEALADNDGTHNLGDVTLMANEAIGRGTTPVDLISAVNDPTTVPTLAATVEPSPTSTGAASSDDSETPADGDDHGG